LIEATQLHDDALSRAFETLDDDGVTALYRRMAATAAERLGLTPRVAPLERTSCPGDGLYHSDTPLTHTSCTSRAASVGLIGRTSITSGWNGWSRLMPGFPGS
jgi:hypothetical protein